MKKILSLLLAFVLLFTITAQAAMTDASAASVYYINLGHTHTADSATHKALQDGFADYVEEASGGRIKVSIYENSILGNQFNLVEATQINTIQMVYVDATTLSFLEPKMQVFDLPFLFENAAIARRAVNSELGDSAAAGLPSRGLYNLVYGESGFRHISTTNKKIASPADMVGLTIRTTENPIYFRTFAALGATPFPLAFAELYTALLVGLVDGQDSMLPVIYGNELYNVQDCLTLTNHVYMPGMLLASNQFWSSLPTDLQQILQQGAYRFRDMQYELLDKENATILKQLQTVMKVTELTAQQRSQFVQATSYVYDLLASEIDPSLVELARRANDTYR